MNVLVVDDDRLVRQGLISAMPWEEFDLHVIGEARNGEKALEFLENHPVDLLLTDLAMPVMSGLELMRIVRDRYPHIFIVILTLHQDFEYIQEALRLGAIDYIAKVQLEEERFDRVLERICERIQSEREKEAARSASVSARLEPAAISVQELAAVRERGKSLDWVQQPDLLETIVKELKELRLPQDRLIGELSYWAEEWNRIYQPIASKRIDLPGAEADWPAIEAWLEETRKRLAISLGAAHYSPEVRACIADAVTFIQENLAEPLQAGAVARGVNMSRSYFSQCFKDIVGSTFNEYVRQRRMERARIYLAQTRKTVQWIAEHTGYADEKYFSRIFREHTGMLPSEYRQRHQESDLRADG